MNTKEKQILEFLLPEGILEWFDIVGGTKTKTEITIVLEEKNIPPPVEPEDRGKRIRSKGFREVTCDDFLARGRRVRYIIKRRRWKIEGKEGTLVRDIELCAKGTQLQQEFADFLKGRS